MDVWKQLFSTAWQPPGRLSVFFSALLACVLFFLLLKFSREKHYHTSWSRYHPQMVRLPWLSSMHLRKFRTSVSQAEFSQELLLWYRLWSIGWAWGAGACWVSAGALLEPPVKRLPMAWPMEEPTATPLQIY